MQSSESLVAETLAEPLFKLDWRDEAARAHFPSGLMLCWQGDWMNATVMFTGFRKPSLPKNRRLGESTPKEVGPIRCQKNLDSGFRRNDVEDFSVSDHSADNHAITLAVLA